MKSLLLLNVVLLLTLAGCSDKPVFTTTVTDQGVALFEQGKPVFFYQKEPKSLDPRYVCNNYLHPLYSLDGDTLTEEFPKDHLFHRGIFWAWHQLSVNGDSVGDGWVNEHISYEVKNVAQDIKKESATLDVNVLWKSAIYNNGTPFIEENTTITVHQSEPELRKIDFTIRLKALVDSLEIGGSNDEKGYGGFCTRVKLPGDLAFISSTGPVEPQNLQLKAGPWMDISGTYNRGVVSGISILDHPSNPGYPSPWILRRKTSMQNIAYPGREKIAIPKEKPLVLKYRLIVHKGDINNVDLNKLHEEYSK